MSERDDIRVLIADDHAVVRMGMKVLLQSAPGIEVVGEASDGAQALRLCTDLRPEVVVMDLSMAGLDGLTAIRRLSQRSDPPRILTLTMHEEDDYLIPALEAGASGYVVKSAASEDLIDAIRAVAAGKMWVRPSAAAVLAAGVARRPRADAVQERFSTLSDREREVFELMAHGHSTTEIGSRLHVSPKTVDTYRRRINEKLGLQNLADYIRLALDLGVLKGR
jgi:DNA-binding NarL/FixJ family response regulator